MPSLSSEHVRWAIVVAIGVLLLAALNVWWIATYRHGYPLNVDEAGYTAMGLVDYIGLRTDGLDGWWEAVEAQAPTAPLVTALTSLLLVIKPGILEGFGTLLGFLVLLAFATYGIGQRLAGPRLGALAALVVATSHGAFLFSREYVFALPTAALLASSVYALLKSDGLLVRRWAIASGVALGLMVLARTMAVAFVPGVVVAAVLLAVPWERKQLKDRAINLGLMVLAGAGVAATWYVRNLQPVLDYLTSYGYGTQSTYYGDSDSTISWDRFKGVAERMISDDVLVPLAALLFVALVILATLAGLRIIEARDRRAAVLSLAGKEAFAVAVVFASGYAALMSSQNGGNGFTFPLAVLLPPLAVVTLQIFRRATVPVVALLAVIATVNVIATSNISDDLSRPRLVKVPAFGELPAVNGVPHTVGAIRVQVPGPTTRFEESDKGWPEADETLAEFLVRPLVREGYLPVAAFASRHRAISSNSVGLASLVKYQIAMPFAQLVAEPTDTVSNYVRQLTDPQLGLPSVLITTSRNTDDFPPLVSQPKAEAAARQLGFQRIRTMILPDGRELRVWAKGPQLAAAYSDAKRPPARRAAAPRTSGSG